MTNIGELTAKNIGDYVTVLGATFKAEGRLREVSHGQDEIEEQTMASANVTIVYGKRWTTLDVGGLDLWQMPSDTPVKV